MSRHLLPSEEIPRAWYNLAADLPTPPPPPLGPDGQPVSPQALAAVFPMNLIEQEVSQERFLPIPEEVLEILLRYRPTPLHRARALCAALGSGRPAVIDARVDAAAYQDSFGATVGML